MQVAKDSTDTTLWVYREKHDAFGDVASWRSKPLPCQIGRGSKKSHQGSDGASRAPERFERIGIGIGVERINTECIGVHAIRGDQKTGEARGIARGTICRWRGARRRPALRASQWAIHQSTARTAGMHLDFQRHGFLRLRAVGITRRRLLAQKMSVDMEDRIRSESDRWPGLGWLGLGMAGGCG
jgi:hypothetical protein